MSRLRLIPCVLLPFAAGYYLSYVFRTINALIAGDLTAELHVNAADLGLLTSVYFLVFAAVQLPLGALLDRYGPKTIQSSLLLLASVGALVFALTDGLIGLIIGRALLSLGVALALMAGFKAIVLWFPPERVVLANGWLVMLGALGALTATTPAEFIVQAVGWRGLFALLAGLSAAAALLVLFAVPEPRAGPPLETRPAVANLWAIYCDPRFWRIAPLSAIGIGTSWSLQGLWAAPWLRDVTGLERAEVVQHLSVMALAVCASALLLGMAAQWLQRRSVKTELVLASTLGMSTVAQTALVLGWPLPSYLVWSVIAAAGAATVLSFAILTKYFPNDMSARANAALNLLHVGGAFVLQTATGLIIAQWPTTNGTYPVEAHQTAMAASLGLQVAALVWFVLSTPGKQVPALAVLTNAPLARAPFKVAHFSTSPSRPLSVWTAQMRLAERHAVAWRFAATVSAFLAIGLTTLLAMATTSSAIVVHVVEVSRPTGVAAGQRDGFADVRPSSRTLVKGPTLHPAIESSASAWSPTVTMRSNEGSIQTNR
ncbi:MAG TPA: MFS transporter [Reyranella sp.]|nr:MFS transporter [Reyranella sp.]